MKLFSPVLIVLVALLISPASANQNVSAFDAYDSGDYTVALREFQPLAERGNILAQYKLGLMYNNGIGVEQDFAVAVKWFSRAAALGHAPAQTMLGVKYEKGQGVDLNYGQAFRWYERGAERGDATAQYRLGRMYVLGQGVERDYTEAAAWFELAAAQGIEDAATARDAVTAQLSPPELAEAELKALQKKAKN